MTAEIVQDRAAGRVSPLRRKHTVSVNLSS
jgi:hypothetical protein